LPTRATDLPNRYILHYSSVNFTVFAFPGAVATL